MPNDGGSGYASRGGGEFILMKQRKAYPGRVIFDHLPKTAGMAITSWLARELGQGSVTSNLIMEHRDLIQKYGGLYSVLCAHINFQIGEELDPRYQYITFFRDPVDRVISWLFFAAYTVPDKPKHSRVKKQAREFLESEGTKVTPELLGDISNVYVRHFWGIGQRSATSDEQKLQSALNAIKKYDVVGLFDQMPQFLADVADLIGLPRPEAIARVNPTNKRPEVDKISEALRSRIIDLNQLDLQLYATVKSWKELCLRESPPNTIGLVTPMWDKYEPKRNRIVVTPDVVIAQATLREGNEIKRGQVMSFDIDFFLPHKVSDLEMGIHILDTENQWAFGINSSLLGQSHKNIRPGSYRVTHHVIAELPAGKYTAGFAFTERAQGNNRELAWYDKLCEFQISLPKTASFAGYSHLPADITLCPTRLALDQNLIHSPIGEITLLSTISSMKPGARINVNVKIMNQGEQAWKGDIFRPVKLSYQWLTADTITMVREGERTELPIDGVLPDQPICVEMGIMAPSTPGNYTLLLSLVQEKVAWLHTLGKGFKVATVEVSVNESD